jgi:protein-disulfide isomerase
MSPRSALAIGIPLLVLALGCPGQRTTELEEGAARDSTPAAEIAGETLTVGEVDAWIKEQLFAQATDEREPSKLYEVRSGALEDIIDERLLEGEAAPLGLTPEELIRKETEKQAGVREEEVLAFYEENKARMGTAAFEQVKPRIERHLQQQRQETAREKYLQALREKASVEVRLDIPRVAVEAKGPSLGPEGAPVTIVEFSDYRCGYCRRAEPVMRQLLERYPSQLRLVSRHFPLNEISRAAAEAAACASQQGRFWEFHGRLFAEGTNLDAERLQQYASDLGLDLGAFQTCVKERRTQNDIEADLEAGREAGVSGTPAFFVNGILVKGARPLDEFVAMIEKELGRSGS